MEDQGKSVDFDQILEIVGSNGRYQTMMAVVTGLAFVPNAMAAMAAVFVAASPKHWCADQQPSMSDNTDDEACRLYTLSNNSLQNNKFNVGLLNEHGNVSSEECTHFVYDTSDYTSTIVTEVRHLRFV